MSRALSLSLVIVALAGQTAVAAPASPAAVDTSPAAEREGRGLADGPPAVDGVRGSNTIDLLIDLQQRSAGLQFNERQRPTGGPGEIKPRAVRPAAQPAAASPGVDGPLAAAPGADTLPRSPAGLFGSGAVPMVQTARTSTVEPRATVVTDNAPVRRPAASSHGEPLPYWLLLPRDVIEYVRENRWLVLSSVAAGLLLIWGASSLFARVAASVGRLPSPQARREFSADRWDSTRPEARRSRRRSHRRQG